MEPLNARSMLDAATSAAAKPADQPFVERRRRLTPAALEVVNQKVARAYSPIVIAGAVRAVDFVVLSLVGIALYFGYVMPLTGLPLGLSRRDRRRRRRRRGLLPGRRHLSGAALPRTAPAD